MNFDRDVAFSNKIRIIDLLNKLANGEEVPNKFKYDNLIFEKRWDNAYFDNEGDNFFDSLCMDFSNLNDEVEIIEEDKKIEKIDIVSMLLGGKEANKEFGKKINEIIDKVNSLENKQ